MTNPEVSQRDLGVSYPGFRTVAQVKENASAIQLGPFTEKRMQEIDHLLGQ